MTRTRDWRREQKFKKRDKARKIIKEVWEITDPEELEKMTQGHSDNMAKCSCESCGNQRKWYGLALQEKKALIED